MNDSGSVGVEKLIVFRKFRKYKIYREMMHNLKDRFNKSWELLKIFQTIDMAGEMPNGKRP